MPRWAERGASRPTLIGDSWEPPEWDGAPRVGWNCLTYACRGCLAEKESTEHMEINEITRRNRLVSPCDSAIPGVFGGSIRRRQRRARDSNPQVLSDASFQVRLDLLRPVRSACNLLRKPGSAR